MDRFKSSKWEVVLGAPDRVNIPCLMRKYSQDVKLTGVHNTYMSSQKNRHQKLKGKENPWF